MQILIMGILHANESKEAPARDIIYEVKGRISYKWNLIGN